MAKTGIVPPKTAPSARKGPWPQVWEDRGHRYPCAEPASLDGFDHGAGRLSERQISFILGEIRKGLRLTTTSRLLEVGCGAGMLLGPLASRVALAVGCDLAESMVRWSRRHFAGLNVLVAEAVALPYQNAAFDAVLMHSVFQYLPSRRYALHVLKELGRVCRPAGRILIADVPDRAKRKAAEQAREQCAEEDPPPWRSSVTCALKHHYYDSAFFERHCARAGYSWRIQPQRVPGYDNGRFRFNVLMRIPSV